MIHGLGSYCERGNGSIENCQTKADFNPGHTERGACAANHAAALFNPVQSILISLFILLNSGYRLDSPLLYNLSFQAYSLSPRSSIVCTVFLEILFEFAWHETFRAGALTHMVRQTPMSVPYILSTSSKCVNPLPSSQVIKQARCDMPLDKKLGFQLCVACTCAKLVVPISPPRTDACPTPTLDSSVAT